LRDASDQCRLAGAERSIERDGFPALQRSTDHLAQLIGMTVGR
jgi:hypothetical protein